VDTNDQEKRARRARNPHLYTILVTRNIDDMKNDYDDEGPCSWEDAQKQFRDTVTRRPPRWYTVQIVDKQGNVYRESTIERRLDERRANALLATIAECLADNRDQPDDQYRYLYDDAATIVGILAAMREVGWPIAASGEGG
jgi:hypothetical protein